jgi:prophage antirepressor-like protein
MTELAPFDFDGLDESAVAAHPEHGPCVHSGKFIKWLGWSNPSAVRRDHFQPGDEVKILTSTKRGGGTSKSNVAHLTKRGVRRLLFRSNHPRAIEYADAVLDMLDELDRSGMVVDEKRITDEQIDQGRQRLDDIAQRRLEEKSDYKAILHALKLGGAVADEYRFVQNTLYLSLFGKSAQQIRTTQIQRTGVLRKRGEGFRKSTVAKDFLAADQLQLLDSTVLATIAQIQLRHKDGATAAQMTDAIHRAISIMRPRSASA